MFSRFENRQNKPVAVVVDIVVGTVVVVVVVIIVFEVVVDVVVMGGAIVEINMLKVVSTL